MRKVIASAAVAAVVATSLSIPQHAEALGPDPYATATIEKISDGTGHGTDTATFVNTANGFTPGDDSPTDGVVSSNDVVQYRISYQFQAGPKRDVDIRLITPDRLDAGNFSELCRQLPNIPTRMIDDNLCRVNMPAGATASLSGMITLGAKDTGGEIVDNQVVKVSVAQSGQAAYAESLAQPVTVVSAPSADLVMYEPYRGADRYNADVSQATGKFRIRVEPLQRPGYSNLKGASTIGVWRAQLDVLSLPTGSKFFAEGKELTVTDGKIALEHSGDLDVTWEFPNKSWEALEPGENHIRDVHLIVDPSSFSAGDYLNSGTGWQPGDGKDRDFDTRDDQLGARSGYIYGNNDWIRIQSFRSAMKGIWDKLVAVPPPPRR